MTAERCDFFRSCGRLINFVPPETEIAFARVAPDQYSEQIGLNYREYDAWRVVAATANGLGEIANSNSNAAKEKATSILADTNW